MEAVSAVMRQLLSDPIPQGNGPWPLTDAAYDVTNGVHVITTDSCLWIVVVAGLFAFFMAWGIGANDVANAFATSVGAGSISLMGACILAAIFEFSGAVLLGAQVTGTVRSGIINIKYFDPNNRSIGVFNGPEVLMIGNLADIKYFDPNNRSIGVFNGPEVLMIGNLAALVAASLWLCLATFLELPVSTTHSIVGSLIGVGLAFRGVDSVQWLSPGSGLDALAGVVGIICSWFISPLLSALLAFIVFLFVRTAVLRRKHPVKMAFVTLPVWYFLTVSIVIVFNGPEVLMIGNLAALVAASLWLLLATFWELPVSTTHSIVGALIGVGLAFRGVDSVQWLSPGSGLDALAGVVGIICSWFISPLLSALLAFIVFLFVRTAVLRRKHPVKMAFVTLPVWYFLTVSIVIFFIIYKGSPALSLDDKFSVGEALGIAFGSGVGAAILCWFTAVPIQRRALEKWELAEIEKIKNPQAFQQSKLGSALSKIGVNVDMDLDAELTERHHTMHANSEKYDPKAEKVFSWMQVFTAAFDSFAHGANDVANAIAPFTAVYGLYNTDGVISAKTSTKADGDLTLVGGPLDGEVIADGSTIPDGKSYCGTSADVKYYGCALEKWELAEIEKIKNPQAFQQSKLGSALSKIGVNVDMDLDADLTERNHTIHANSEKFDPKAEKVFSWMQVFTAAFDSFAHGANDVANAIAPFTAVYGLYSTDGVISAKTSSKASGDVTLVGGPLDGEVIADGSTIPDGKSYCGTSADVKYYGCKALFPYVEGAAPGASSGSFPLYNTSGDYQGEKTCYSSCNPGCYPKYSSVKQDVPVWILAMGGAGIVTGLAMWGYKIILAIGKRLTKVTAARGFSIELGAAITVLIASRLGLPVSTTHCQVGATIGVGSAEGKLNTVDWVQFLIIFAGWVGTLFFCGFLAAGVFAFATLSPYKFASPQYLAAIGKKLTKVTAARGFSIELGAAITVLIASRLGLPVSTTHCQVGATIGVGMAEGKLNTIDWVQFLIIFAGWVGTLVFCGFLAAGIFAFATLSPYKFASPQYLAYCPGQQLFIFDSNSNSFKGFGCAGLS
eukprot:CAMPEP_0184706938 /NCGR_PEP_ID=MMETSP0313-20130426/37010_1 /TAXON_ID=2792 /ORGANISM="Porphyridium aerugineum, Strain SAG 1380-2" /LENGTH=1066 /DNA_ID=CAMNT_0027168507 /DNA_START=681 /DNA_END=3882 /DNA_ORIENTATION=-